jgi:glycogen synthase
MTALENSQVKLRSSDVRDGPEVGDAAVAILFPGDPTACSTWSGTPLGVLTGFTQSGIDACPVATTPPELVHSLALNAVALAHLHRSLKRGAKETLRLSRRLARNTPAMSVLYTRAATHAISKHADLTAVVQIGTGYGIDTTLPLVTYEDMTIVQALDCGYPEWNRLSRRSLRRRIDFQRRAYERAIACCATTFWAADSIVRDYGVSPDKVHVVGVGRNHSVDPPEQRDWSVPRYLFVGWEWERKNGPRVVQAFERVRAQIPEAQLALVGRHDRIGGPGIHDYGILRLDKPDQRKRAEELFRSSTCFVMPSRCEPSALAYIEAGHAGLPAIGTTVGGFSDQLRDGGRAVDPQDLEGLVDAMLEFANPDIAARAGSIARARSQLYTWPSVASRLLRAALGTAASDSELEPFLQR